MNFLLYAAHHYHILKRKFHSASNCFSLSESTRKLILERYVSRYEAHVTPSMVASVPSHGNEHMASEIMAVGPIQVRCGTLIERTNISHPSPNKPVFFKA